MWRRATIRFLMIAEIWEREEVTHILWDTRMWYSDGSLFHKKSQNMGPICYKSIPKHGTVLTKFQKNCKNGSIFWEKSLKFGTSLLPKWPLKGVLKLERHTVCKANLSTPSWNILRKYSLCKPKSIYILPFVVNSHEFSFFTLLVFCLFMTCFW